MSCVFNGMELPCDCYAPDVREIMSDTIERFGKEEWYKVVLTNEIHGHLGIYSTLGAKMGCYAMSLHEGDDEPHPKRKLYLHLQLDQNGDLTGGCQIRHLYNQEGYEGPITLRKGYFKYGNV